MTFRYRSPLPFTLGIAMALAVSVSLVANGVGVSTAVLKTIGSRVDGRTGVITIEATDPVPYVASQPDPLTFVVELRDVNVSGYSDGFKADPRSPVSAVQVESARADDGAAVARVRLSLTQPLRPRVRSARNLIIVEADRVDGSVAAGVISGVGRASAIRDVRVTKRGSATAFTLLGTGRLIASAVEEPKDGPRRLVIDLPNVTSSLPTITPVGQGPIDRVRIALSPSAPLVTRVTLELARAATYRMEPSEDGQNLTVVFDEPVQDPISALADRPRASQSQVPPATAAPQPAVAPAAAAPSAAPAQGLASGGTTRYTGHPVSLDFQGADLRAVLRTFAEISGLNIVIDPSIQGSVDVALRDVPWDQALDIILRANKLGYLVDGTIVRIAPLTVLADEEAQRQKLIEAQALAGELRVYTRSLSYARAEALRPLLESTVLSQRGSVRTDERTNTLIISDLSDRIDRAAALINSLDSPQPQVEIEARIVQTTREFARTLGVQWGFNGRATNALGNTLPFAFPNQASIGGRTGSNQGANAPDPQTDAAGTAVNLPVSGASSALGLALGSVNGAVNLDVALSALERQGQGRLLSTPRVSTQNNVEAEITQGVQIPIQTVANNTVTVTFRDAALTLRVTPQITASNTVIMRIAVENAAPDYSRSINNIPPIDTQRALTQVLVSDGDTTVIGGIYVSREQASQDRTPGLYRLPLLGWLFKRDGITDESRELLIFITPKIIRL